MKKIFILLSALVLQACVTTAMMRNEPLTDGFAQEFEGAFEEVLGATRESVLAVGLVIDDANQMPSGSWMILARKGSSTWCSGEMVRVIIEQQQEEASVFVRVVSRHRASGDWFCRASDDYSASIFSAIQLALAAPSIVVSAPEEGPTTTTTSLGSGFILPSRTIAGTNYHVIEGASSVEVWSPLDREWLPSRVVRFDPANDLALVEVPEALRPAASTPAYGVRAATDIRVGAEVHAIGFPASDILGSRSRFTTGTISADVGIEDDPRLFQITASIQPGNSGGPLVDAYGQVIGIVVATLNSSLFLEITGSVPQNVNFAIKIDYLRLLAGNDFGLPGDTPASALEGSDVAERMEPWVIRIRATEN